MILLRVINEDGTKVDLDLYQGEDLRLDMSAIEAGEIGDVFGVSSQQYALPGSDINNQFFGNLYNLGATPATSFTKTIPCQVLYKGAEVFSGKMYLENVVTNQKGDTVYNIVVVNEIVDFKFLINDLVMQDLVWSDYDHQLTMANITSSWDDNLFGGDIIYPLINYGVDTEDQFAANIEAGGDPKQFDNSSTPLRDIDFRPAIKAKAVIDKIFEATNYTYSSSFFDSAYFDKLYILSTQAETGNQFANPTTASLDARVGSTQNLTNNTPAFINFATEIYDNGANWTTNVYEAFVADNYTFYAQLNFGNIVGTRPTANEDLYLEWWNPVTAQVLASTIIDLSNTIGPQVYIGPTTLPLAVGDKVQLRASISTPVSFSATYPIVTGKILANGAAINIGGQVDISKIWEDNTPVIEVLKGIINKFNLVFEPVQNERNTIIVEPFNNWVDGGQVVDWTDKVDRSVKFSITHPLQTQPRKLLFTDVEDTDALNAYTRAKFDKQYGEYRYTSDSDLAVGEKTIGSFFAPFPIKGIDGAPTMLVPMLAQREAGNPPSQYKYRPRLVYNVGKVNVPPQVRGYNANTGVYNPGNFWLRDDASNPVLSDEYLLVHHLNLDVVGGVLQDSDVSTTLDLHYGNLVSPGQYSYHQNQYNAKAKRSAFHEYWAFYINELYDVDSRKLTLNIKLDPTEIQNIRLNDKIFIDGAYYRIDKIVGANLQKEDSIEVVLLKTLPRKLYFPRRRVIGLDGVVTDIVVDDTSVSAGGSVDYVDFESGVVVTGSAVGAVSNKDGLTTYGDNTIWNNTPPASYTLTAQDNFGNNQIEISSNKVNVTGENNVIKASTSKVNVLGEGNTVSEYTQYSTVTGQNNTLGLRSKNATIVGTKDSTITNGSELSTIIAGNSSSIDDSTTSMVAGPRIILSGSEDTIVIGNGGVNTSYTITDMQNVVVINPTRDITSTVAGGDDTNNYAFVGSNFRIGSLHNDVLTLDCVSSGSSQFDSDPTYKDINTVWLNTKGSSPFADTHKIYLPSTVTKAPTGGRDYPIGYHRKLTFLVDNTLNSGDVVLFPSGSELINGSTAPTGYNVGGAYATLTIFGANGNWWVL